MDTRRVSNKMASCLENSAHKYESAIGHFGLEDSPERIRAQSDQHDEISTMKPGPGPGLGEQGQDGLNCSVIGGIDRVLTSPWSSY